MYLKLFEISEVSRLLFGSVAEQAGLNITRSKLVTLKAEKNVNRIQLHYIGKSRLYMQHGYYMTIFALEFKPIAGLFNFAVNNLK